MSMFVSVYSAMKGYVAEVYSDRGPEYGDVGRQYLQDAIHDALVTAQTQGIEFDAPTIMVCPVCGAYILPDSMCHCGYRPPANQAFIDKINQMRLARGWEPIS